MTIAHADTIPAPPLDEDTSPGTTHGKAGGVPSAETIAGAFAAVAAGQERLRADVRDVHADTQELVAAVRILAAVAERLEERQTLQGATLSTLATEVTKLHEAVRKMPCRQPPGAPGGSPGPKLELVQDA